jgi:hypothetical protein
VPKATTQARESEPTKEMVKGVAVGREVVRSAVWTTPQAPTQPLNQKVRTKQAKRIDQPGPPSGMAVVMLVGAELV